VAEPVFPDRATFLVDCMIPECSIIFFRRIYLISFATRVKISSVPPISPGYAVDDAIFSERLAMIGPQSLRSLAPTGAFLYVVFGILTWSPRCDAQVKRVYAAPSPPKLVPSDSPSFAPLDVEADRFIRVRQARAEFGVSGAGLAVVVVDTGVNPHHVSFQGQLLPGANFTGVGAVDNTVDVGGHGSNVAGIIAAKRLPPNEEMPTGIAPGAKIIPLKVFRGEEPEKIGTDSVVKALNWALTNAENAE
jgi:subtilisin family serine protease